MQSYFTQAAEIWEIENASSEELASYLQRPIISTHDIERIKSRIIDLMEYANPDDTKEAERLNLINEKLAEINSAVEQKHNELHADLIDKKSNKQVGFAFASKAGKSAELFILPEIILLSLIHI